MLSRFGTVCTGWIDIVVLLFLCFFIRNSTLFSLRQRRFYLLSACTTILVILAEGLTVFASGRPGRLAYLLHLFGNLAGFSLSAALPVLLACLFSDLKNIFPHPWLMWSPVLLTAALSLSSFFTGWIFYVGPDNSYGRGPLFFVFVITYLYGFALLLRSTLLESEKFDPCDRLCLFALTGLVVAGTTIQVLFPTIYASWHCATAGLLLYYIFLRELYYRVDPVTQVFCRAAFDRDLASLSPCESAVLIFDVNNFKQVNDRFGHEVGDRCLFAAGQLLSRAFAPMGKCYRLGGDEFAVLAATYSDSLMEHCIKDMTKEICSRRLALPMLPYISYGCGVCHGNVVAARAEADAQMYLYKGQVEAPSILS